MNDHRAPLLPNSAQLSPAWVQALKGVFLLATVLMLRELSALLLPVAMAFALAFVLATPVQKLRNRGIPDAYGAALIVGVLLLTLVAVMGTLASPAAAWINRAPDTLSQLLDSLDKLRAAMSPQHKGLASSGLLERAVPPSNMIKDHLATEGLGITRMMIGHLFSFGLSVSATVILLYFLLASHEWLVLRFVQSIESTRARALLLAGIRQAQRDIGLYLGTMGLINICLGTVSGLLLAAIGLPNPVLWSAVIAVLAFVPYLGPALLTALLLLAGNMSFGFTLSALLPPAIFLGCHAIESNIVSPLVMGRRLHLSPLAVFLSVMMWGWIWGFGGTLVAVPMLLGVRAWWRRSRRFKHACFYLEGGYSSAPSLRTLLTQRRSRLPAVVASPTPLDKYEEAPDRHVVQTV